MDQLLAIRAFSRVVEAGNFTKAADSLRMPKATVSFLARYPEIRMDLGVSDRDIDLIGDNVDCVIRGGALADTGLVSRAVGRLAWVTCATPAYLERMGTPKVPQDLETDHRVVNYLCRCALRAGVVARLPRLRARLNLRSDRAAKRARRCRG